MRVYVGATIVYGHGPALYSAPNSNAQVIGRLPIDTVATIVKADKQHGEYLHVTDVELVEDEPATRATFPRIGWLRVDNAYVDVQPEMHARRWASLPAMAATWPQLYESPTEESPPRHQLGDEPGAAQLRGCMGTWVDVQLTDRDQVHRGWLKQGDYCGNPVTTCND